MATPTIIEALDATRLLGASFPDRETWGAWRTFLAALYGLRLDPPEQARFCAATGRSEYRPRPGGYTESLLLCGRQAGKSTVAAALACYEAVTAPPVRDGETWVLVLAQDQRGAIRTVFRYIESMFDRSSLLAPLVVSRTSDTLRLSNGVNVGAYPCRAAAIRGLRARAVIVDEVCFFRSTDLYPVDREVVRAARPCLANTGGRLVALSSPYGASGWAWDTYRRHYGRDDSDTLLWQSSAVEMNPRLTPQYVERMVREDAEAAEAEIFGRFRAGLAQLFDPEAIDACVRSGHVELPPSHALDYAAFADPSGGRRDAFTLAVGHTEGHGDSRRAVVDLLRAWRPPFNPAGVTSECCDLLKRYGIHKVVGDRYAGEWPREQFRAGGIRYELADAAKSDLYLNLLAYTNAGRVVLPDDRDLLR